MSEVLDLYNTFVASFLKKKELIKNEWRKENLISYINTILKAIKDFFRHLLQIGNEKVKEATTKEIKDYYDNEDFEKDDIYDIAIDTTKEDELFDYANIDKLYTKENNYNDFEI